MKNENGSIQLNMLALEEKLQVLAELQEISEAAAFCDSDQMDEEELDEETLSLVTAARKMNYRTFFRENE